MLSKSTEYAIRALVYIQLKNWQSIRPLVSDVAREIEAPEPFTAKILQTLAKRGMVRSMKGRGGGFFYAEDQSNIPLFEVINMIEGDTLFHKCGFGLNSCDNENPCPLHDKYMEIRDGYFDIVQNETIQSLSKKIMDGTAVLNRSVM